MSNDINALILFVDMRGFTRWAGIVDNFSFIDEFINRWYELLRNTFCENEYYIKNLGDGAMVIKEIETETTETILKDILSDTLMKIENTKTGFRDLCKEFSIKKGSKILLDLGWGITKGAIKKTGSEYVGPEINKCSRYCDIARPYGIVIDAIDFQEPFIPTDIELYKQTRMLKGINEDADVWVTKEIYTQFLTREEFRQSPEVHVSGICFKRDKERDYVLLGKRKLSRSLFPGLYEGCGGQLANNETFEDGVKRHYKLEYGINVEVMIEEHVFYDIIKPNKPLIPGISFLCDYISGEPKSENHEAPTPKWFSKEDFEEIPESDFIEGLKARTQGFFKKFNSIKNKKIK